MNTPPTLLRSQPAAWATLAVDTGQSLMSVVGERAGARLLEDLTAGRSMKSSDVHLALLGQLAPRLFSAVAGRARLAWKQALVRDVDRFVVDARAGKTLLWHERRHQQAAPPDTFAALPWLAEQRVEHAAAMARSIVACAVPMAIAAGRGDTRHAFFLAALVFTTLLTDVLFKTVFSTQRQRCEQQEHHAHHAFGQMRHAFWDNIVLGNASNERRWRGTYDHAIAQHERTKVNTLLSHGFLTMAAPVSSTLFASAATALMPRDDTHHLRAELANWPSLMVNIREMGTVLREVGQLLRAGQTISSHQRAWQQQTQEVKQTSALTPHAWIDDAVAVRQRAEAVRARAWIKQMDETPGRWSVEGPTGAGKFMTLLQVKAQLGAHALLLPDHHDLMFGQGPGSSGERARAALLQAADDTIADPSITHVLLHRWDGNLDARNEEELDAVIDRIAQVKQVVEVRRAATGAAQREMALP